MSHQQDSARSRRELVADVLRAPSAREERRIMLALLELEHLAANVYAVAAANAEISPGGRELARRLGAQERAHAAALAPLTGQAAPPPPDLSPTALQAALAGHGVTVSFRSLHDERAWFTVLEKLERNLEGAYYRALGHLTRRANVTLAARILASEAQHATLLFSYRNPARITLDVSTSFVTGTATPPAVAGG